jgi:hypothetical protein
MEARGSTRRHVRFPHVHNTSGQSLRIKKIAWGGGATPGPYGVIKFRDVVTSRLVVMAQGKKENTLSVSNQRVN